MLVSLFFFTFPTIIQWRIHISTVSSSDDWDGNNSVRGAAQLSQSMPRVEAAIGKDDVAAVEVIPSSIELVCLLDGLLDGGTGIICSIDVSTLVGVVAEKFTAC